MPLNWKLNIVHLHEPSSRSHFRPLHYTEITSLSSQKIAWISCCFWRKRRMIFKWWRFGLIVTCWILMELITGYICALFSPVALRPVSGSWRPPTGRTTLGRTPLDEWSARRRDLYLTTHNIHNRKDIHALGGIRTHNLSRREAADLRLRPRCHWDRHPKDYTLIIKL